MWPGWQVPSDLAGLVWLDEVKREIDLGLIWSQADLDNSQPVLRKAPGDDRQPTPSRDVQHCGQMRRDDLYPVVEFRPPALCQVRHYATVTETRLERRVACE